MSYRSKDVADLLQPIFFNDNRLKPTFSTRSTLTVTNNSSSPHAPFQQATLVNINSPGTSGFNPAKKFDFEITEPISCDDEDKAQNSTMASISYQNLSNRRPLQPLSLNSTHPHQNQLVSTSRYPHNVHLKPLDYTRPATFFNVDRSELDLSSLDQDLIRMNQTTEMNFFSKNLQKSSWNQDEGFSNHESMGYLVPASPNNTYQTSNQRTYSTVPNYSSSPKICTPTPTKSTVTLRRVSELPDRFRSLFPFDSFNPMQSQSIDLALYSNVNLVVSAPTGAGKTVIFELAMIHLLMQSGGDRAKMVYMAPTKKLCVTYIIYLISGIMLRTRQGLATKVSNYRSIMYSVVKSREQKFFKHLSIPSNTYLSGLSIFIGGELTGDTDQAHSDDPRKMGFHDASMERSSISSCFVETLYVAYHYDICFIVHLLRFIDEVHMLKEKRGATLEAVVSRMKTMGNSIRFIALSATVPNVDDVAAWIGLEAQYPNEKANILQYGEEYRPVHLVRHVLSYPMEGINGFMFDKKLDYKLLEIIQTHSNGKSTLVFCATRKSTEAACHTLVQQLQDMKKNGTRLPWIIQPTKIVPLKDKKIQDLCVWGIAFHHAGLDFKDRKTIETMFINGVIRVVNLPAHLVIIKSTLVWNNQQYTEYSDLEIMQMLGRAGRPQFDDSGVAVIMTSHNMKSKYENLVSGTEVLESSLHENLTEHLNAEISLGTIDNVQKTMQWLRSTFLYVRIKLNPTFYKLEGDEHRNFNFEKQLEVSIFYLAETEICAKDLDLLNESDLISKNGDSLKITEYGEAMAKYYLKYRTMANIVHLHSKADIKDLLELLSKAEEFYELRFHQGEKQVLNNINKSPDIRFPIKGRVTRVDQKIFLMLQCLLGNIAFSDPKMGFQMNMEANVILQHSPRLIECMVQKRDVVSLQNSLDLSRCLKAKTWENSPCILRQLDGIGQQYARLLATAGIQTFAQLENCDARRIEMIVNRNPPFGNQVLDALSLLPQFKLDVTLYSEYSSTDIELNIEISITNTKVKTKNNGMSLFATFLAVTTDAILLDYRRFPLTKVQQGFKFRIKVKLTAASQNIICSVLLEDYVGLDVKKTIDPGIDPSKFNNSINPTTIKQLLRHENELLTNWDEADQYLTEDPVPSLPPRLNLYLDHNPKDERASEERDLIQEVELIDLVDDNLEKLPNGRFKCSHACKDKEKCAHECCKVGCRHKPKKRKGLFLPGSEPTYSAEKRIKQNESSSIQESNVSSKGAERFQESTSSPGQHQEKYGKDMDERAFINSSYPQQDLNFYRDGKGRREDPEITFIEQRDFFDDSLSDNHLIQSLSQVNSSNPQGTSSSESPFILLSGDQQMGFNQQQTNINHFESSLSELNQFHEKMNNSNAAHFPREEPPTIIKEIEPSNSLNNQSSRGNTPTPFKWPPSDQENNIIEIDMNSEIDIISETDSLKETLYVEDEAKLQLTEEGQQSNPNPNINESRECPSTQIQDDTPSLSVFQPISNRGYNEDLVSWLRSCTVASDLKEKEKLQADHDQASASNNNHEKAIEKENLSDSRKLRSASSCFNDILAVFDQIFRESI
ncbi:hypothetical protein G9A89_011010 [Geosiphon pyriformis]|nr:hypothetical protein G9A89_011010 [Geosiphon pyriformis]